MLDEDPKVSKLRKTNLLPRKESRLCHIPFVARSHGFSGSTRPREGRIHLYIPFAALPERNCGQLPAAGRSHAQPARRDARISPQLAGVKPLPTGIGQRHCRLNRTGMAWTRPARHWTRLCFHERHLDYAISLSWQEFLPFPAESGHERDERHCSFLSRQSYSSGRSRTPTYRRHLSMRAVISAGTGESKSISLPVVGWTKPSTLAWSAWRGSSAKQLSMNCLYLV